MGLARSRGMLAAAALAIVCALGGAGCNTYKYYNIHVTFDNAGSMPFTTASAFSVQSCVVNVSGADSSQFRLPQGRCPNMTPGGNVLDPGVFEFSTFADSGNLTFTIDAFQDVTETAACKIGHGTVTLPVSATITTAGDLKIVNTGTSCVTTGNTQGDAGLVVKG